MLRRFFYRGRGLGGWTERYQKILLFWLLLLVLQSGRLLLRLVVGGGNFYPYKSSLDNVTSWQQ